MNPMMLFMVGGLLVIALGGVAFVFVQAGSDTTKKRVASVTKASPTARASKGAIDTTQQRRKNTTTMLKELEVQQAQQSKRPPLRRRIEQAGLAITQRTYWICAAISGFLGALGAYLLVHILFVVPLAAFAFTFGFPSWVLSFLKKRREKAFMREFAPAIDTIVRSVKTGLPVNEALKLVGSEIPEPVGGEFRLLTEGLKVGIPMDDGLKRMYERMPTAEVNFFGIVMAIQQKTGGNLSEALGNLAGVLRDRKRMQAKIRAMSSEAKAGAMIIGSLPPSVMLLIYITTPDYISLLITSKLGNLMLLACVCWMACGIFIMKKMIAFKF